MSRYDTPEWQELVGIQNILDHTDILSITGFMNDEQFEKHLAIQRIRVKNFLEDFK